MSWPALGQARPPGKAGRSCRAGVRCTDASADSIPRLPARLAWPPLPPPPPQPSPPAPAGALAAPPSPHPAAICQATRWPRCARGWAPRHGSTRARTPREHVCAPRGSCGHAHDWQAGGGRTRTSAAGGAGRGRRSSWAVAAAPCVGLPAWSPPSQLRACVEGSGVGGGLSCRKRLASVTKGLSAYCAPGVMPRAVLEGGMAPGVLATPREVEDAIGPGLCRGRRGLVHAAGRLKCPWRASRLGLSPKSAGLQTPALVPWRGRTQPHCSTLGGRPPGCPGPVFPQVAFMEH